MSENEAVAEQQKDLYLHTEGRAPRRIINLGSIKNPGRQDGWYGSKGNPGDHEYVDVLVAYTPEELRNRNNFGTKGRLPLLSSHHRCVVRREKVGPLK
jgi:hypothetical protein